MIRTESRDRTRKIITAGTMIEWPDAWHPKLFYTGTVQTIEAGTPTRRTHPATPDMLIVLDRLGVQHRVRADRADVMEDQPTGMDTAVYLDQDELRVIESALSAFRAEIKLGLRNYPKADNDRVYGDTEDLLRRVVQLGAKITNSAIDLDRAHSA